MSDAISKFERTIDRINIVYGLMFPVGLMTLIAAGTWILVPTYFQPGSFPIWLFIILSVAAIFGIHLKHLDSMSMRQLVFLYTYYNIALIIFCVFVAPYRSPYEFLWVALAVGMDMVFRKKWIYLTFALFAVVGTIMFYKTNQPKTAEVMLASGVQYVGVISISILMTRYRRVSDEERLALAETSRNTTYERQRLLSLINNMGEAVVATDSKGKILLYNAATLNLLDTNQSLDKKNIDSVLKLKTYKQKPIKLFKSLQDSDSGITSSEYIHEYGPNDHISMYINATPIKLGFGENTDSGYIIIMRDITKEKSLEEERDEFISVVSHELRTPVAIAEGNISNAMFMSAKHHDPKIVTNSLNQAHDQVVYLANMINDLATLSRAERTDVPLEISTVDVKVLAESIARDYQSEAAAKNLKLTVSVAEDTKAIQSAQLYLQEILQNFVTNAIKYTKQGTILVHVRSNAKDEAVFSVADSGIGLSKSDQKRVFEKFFRSEDFRTRESSGTGLGLYVTSKLAHRLNAKIELESELNKGTTFTITVPSLAAPRHGGK